MIVWVKVGGILAAVLLVFFAGYHVGGLAPKLSNAKAEIKTALAAQQQTHTDETTIAQEAKAYEDARLAPIAAPAVRVCEYSPAGAVRSPAAAGSGAHAPAAVDRTTEVPAVPGPDIGPGLMRAAAIATAQVTALQDYVAKVCLAGDPGAAVSSRTR